MEGRVTMDKMPTFVKETMGQAQKRLTLLEGETRKMVSDTWMRLAEGSRWQQVGQALSDWRTRADKTLQLENLRLRTQTLGNQVSDRAFHTVGLVTQADLHTLVKQVDRLRKDVRRLVRKASNPRNRAKTKPA